MKRARHQTPARRAPALDWRAALLALAVVVTYANSLSGAFVLDDQAAIVQNGSLRDPWSRGGALSPPPDSPVAWRPIVNLSFAVNYAFGGLDVRGYHAWNIGVHLLCALLAYAFIRQTLELPRVRERFDGDPRAVAFAAALLWAVHPLNSEVVNYLSQRTESMMAACYLLTMYAAARSVGGSGARRWTIVAVTASIAGVLCKESMATVPLVVVAFDRIFLYRSWRDLLRARRLLYGGLALSWAVLVLVLAANPRGGVAGLASGVSPWTYLLNQALMIAAYLRLSVWPDALVAFYGWPEPLSLRDVLPQALSIAALLAATAVALVRAPMAAFVGLWFFVTLAPASSVVPISTEVGAERRMYLPLLALVVAAVLAVREVWRRGTVRMGVRPLSPRAAAAAAVTGVAAALAGVTALRNLEYASALTLTRTIVERRPTPVAHHMHAEQLLSEGRGQEAETHLRQAIAGGNSRARYPLGIELFNRGDADAAIEQLEAFLRTAGITLVPKWLEPPAEEVLRARTALGLALLQKEEWDRAAEQAHAVLAVVPRYAEARKVLAHARFGQQRWAEALVEYQAYLASRPDDVQALLNVGVALVATDRLGEALPVFRRAFALDPSNPSAKRLLGLAEEDARRSQALKP